MKHPLTSKERRGLVAVAAAALLCIASGFIARSCGATGHSEHADTEIPSGQFPTSDSARKSDRAKKDTQSKKKEKTETAAKKKGKNAKAGKKNNYPTRDPLSQPCD